GCSSLADVRASRWNRSTNSLSNARENGRTLIATSRSSCFSRALKTMAIPPRPSSSRISYSSCNCSRTRSSAVASTCWSRTPRPAGRRSDERLPDSDAHRQRKVVAQRRPTRELESGGAQSGEARRRAGGPGVTRVGEQVEPQPVDAEGEVTEGLAHQRERHPVLEAARGRALASQLARRVPPDGQRARCRQRL